MKTLRPILEVFQFITLKTVIYVIHFIIIIIIIIKLALSLISISYRFLFYHPKRTQRLCRAQITNCIVIKNLPYNCHFGHLRCKTYKSVVFT